MNSRWPRGQGAMSPAVQHATASLLRAANGARSSRRPRLQRRGPDTHAVLAGSREAQVAWFTVGA
ncbi:MAG: hypothetical protein QOE54_5651 [Streptosporangiaceae bacterium]|nr:hypothetical protein [Streptosporangiaceae bacterium]